MPAATALRLRDATPADASALIALDSVAAATLDGRSRLASGWRGATCMLPSRSARSSAT